MGWVLIAGAAILGGVAVVIIVKHDFTKVEGFHFAATTDEDNKLAALGLMFCGAGAYALFHFGSGML